MSAADRTYYDVLGVSRDTPFVVIKAAYRALAKEYHPDSGSEAAAEPERFLELQDAYAVLSDAGTRRAYDGALMEAAETATELVETRSAVPFAGMAYDSPALQVIHARFMLFSEPLASAFHEAASTERSEEDLLTFAQLLETHFLNEYFGGDEDVCAMAGLLLLQCRKQALFELNELAGAMTGVGRAERRRRLSAFADRHFTEPSAYSSWLKARFVPHDPAPAAPDVSRVLASRQAVARQRGFSMRSAAKVVCWSFAMYLGICFASAFSG
ncbi:J domain-containing protein [Aestuariivirga sp.]|uniref:J domain-containing protein n=1 Tax=Aestuariivirga sp. TaxID=2650926 RepID=UPI003BABEE7F